MAAFQAPAHEEQCENIRQAEHTRNILSMLDPMGFEHCAWWVEGLKKLGCTPTASLNSWTRSRPLQQLPDSIAEVSE